MERGKTIAILVVFLIVIVGGVFLVQPKNKNDTIDTKPIQDSSLEVATNYVKYSEDNLAKAKINGRPVLYFWASWCPTCKMLDEELRGRGSELPSNVTILQVNYDTEKELKQKYQIVQQHTLVQIDNEGKEVSKWIGGGIDTVKQQLK